MKPVWIIGVLLCTSLGAGAETKLIRDDSVLIKRIAKLEEKVSRNQKKIEMLERQGPGTAKQSAKQQAERTTPQKAVVNRRGSKQVVFE